MENDPQIGSPEWYKALQDRLRKSLEEIKAISGRISSFQERLNMINAEIIMSKIKNDNIKKMSYISKMYDPFSELTKVEKIVIEMILKEEE